MSAPPPLWTREFTSLLIAQAGFGYAFSTFFLLPEFLHESFGSSPREVGFVMATYGLTAVPAVPAMGAAVDRFGRRDFLTAGAVLMALASLGYAAVESMGPAVYALRALQGLAFAMAFSAGSALAVDEAPPERVAEAIGLFGLTFLSMNAIAPAVTEEIAARSGWSLAFGVAAGGAALCCLLSRTLRERPREVATRPAGLFEVARRGSQMRLMLVIALVGMAMCAMFVFHQRFAKELGFERVRGFFVAYAVAAVFVRLALGRVADRFGRRRVALGSLVLYVPVVLAMRWLGFFGLEWLGAGLGFAHGLHYPALNAIAIQVSAPDERGKVMSLFQAAFIVGFAGGASILGLIAEARGFPDVFAVGSACVAAGLVVLWASPEGRR